MLDFHTEIRPFIGARRLKGHSYLTEYSREVLPQAILRNGCDTSNKTPTTNTLTVGACSLGNRC